MTSNKDQTSNKGWNKHNSDLQDSALKLSNTTVKEKFIKKKVSNSRNSNSESNFECCKRLGLLKRNTAQDRLKRIRSNIDVKKKLNDKIEKFQESKNDNTQRSKKSHVLKKTFLPKNVNFTYKNSSLRAEKYSADVRLKKIRAITKKTTQLDEHVGKNIGCNDSPLSTYKENDIKKKSPEISSAICLKSDVDNKSRSHGTFVKPGNKTAGSTSYSFSNAADKLLDVCDMSMDVDVEDCIRNELLDVNSSNKHSSPSLKNSENNPDDWANVTETNVIFVNEEISKIRKESIYQALHESFMSDVEMNLALPSGDLFIVIDTNIFLSDLQFLYKLLKYEIPPYRSPVIVVPWLVIQEIDYAMKKDNPRLSSQAKLANRFIYDCLKKKLPNFFGQSLQDFKENFKNAVCIDDYILQYCLKFVSLRNDVILLTDDINLCNKSMVNQLTVFTKKEFKRTFKFV